MGPKRKSVSSKFKNIYATCFLVMLVVAVFLTQIFLIYRMYSLNVEVLKTELNASAREVYDIGLDLAIQNTLLEDSLSSKYLIERSKELAHLPKLKEYISKIDDKNKSTSSIVKSIEECMNNDMFLNLQQLDSISQAMLLKNNLDCNFYIEVVNPETYEVYQSTKPRVKMSITTFESEIVSLGEGQTKALRIVLINPLTPLYRQLAIFITLFIVVCVVLSFSFYYQQKLLRKQKLLVEIKNDLFADISHEMKRPLSIMSLVISSLEEENILKDAKKRLSFLKIARKEIDQMSNQTEMVLSLAKDDKGTLELDYVSFDIVEMVSDLADKYTYVTDKAVNIEIDNKIDNPFIYGDPQHMEHVIANLLTNSIKYSSDSVFVKISLYEEDGYFCLSIKDNGVGMTKEEQIHVFERYYRTGKVSDAQGYGIGLNYVDRVVKKCNGSIVLVSEPNKGSEFIIKLPLQLISSLN